MGLFNSIGNIASTIIGGVFGNKQQGTQIDHDQNMASSNYYYAEKSAENAYQRQVDMWNMNNDYNSASSNVERLEDAGLNPALYYGSSSASSPANVPSVPQGNGSYGHSSNVMANPAFLSALADIELKSKQADNVEQDTKNKMSTDELIKEQVKEVSANTHEALSKTDLNRKQLLEIDGKITLMSQQVAHLLADTGRIQSETNRNDAQRLLFIDQSTKLKAETKYTIRSLKKLGAEINHLVAGTNYYDSQKNLSDMQTSYYDRKKIIETIDLGIRGGNAIWNILENFLPKGLVKTIIETSKETYDKKGRYQGGTITTQTTEHNLPNK